MKNAFKIALIAGISLSTFVAEANDGDFSLKSKSETEKTISFQINEANDFTISLFAEDNELLFEQKLHPTTNSTKTYDLNELPDGNYMMTVESGSTLEQYKIAIADGKAIFSAPKVTELHKPVITKSDDDMITLSFEQAKGDDVEVRVLNESNDELYAETFKNKTKLSKKFNVSRADGKDLTFVIKAGDQTFIKTIETR